MNTVTSRISPSLWMVSTYIILVVIGIWALVIPEVKSVMEVKGQVVALQNQTNSASKSAKPKDVVSMKDVDLADLLVPAQDMQYDLSVQVDGLTRNMGIPLSSLSITGATVTAGTKTSAANTVAVNDATSGWSKLTISLTTSSSYANIQNLLNGMVGLNRLIRIDQVSLTQAGGTAGSVDNLSAQISAFAYYDPTSTTQAVTAIPSPSSGPQTVVK